MPCAVASLGGPLSKNLRSLPRGGPLWESLYSPRNYHVPTKSGGSPARYRSRNENLNNELSISLSSLKLNRSALTFGINYNFSTYTHCVVIAGWLMYNI